VENGSFNSVVGSSAGSISLGSTLVLIGWMYVSKWKVFAKV
jgi:hypothetical protein